MRSRGFTLVELLVSTAIFAVVMTISVGALLSLADANKKAQAIKSVMNNLNFALESMARNMRVGFDYHCEEIGTLSNIETPQDCSSNGGVLLAFEAHDGNIETSADQVVYRYDATNKRIERSEDGGATFSYVTAPEVQIDELKFYALNTSRADNNQAKIVITLKGTAQASDLRIATTFAIQTTVSQRLLDI